MADPSESTLPLENLRIASEVSCWMCASSDSPYVTAIAPETESAILSSSTTFFSASSEPMSSERSEADDRSVEDAIERSKVHWSELSERCEFGEEEVEVSNVEIFRSLQEHPTWGDFFFTFGGGGIYDFGELEVGDKFAEGAQAELYHAHVTWKNAKYNSYVEDHGLRYVLKVFRKGTSLHDLQKQWPEGMFKQREERMRLSRLGESLPPRYSAHIECGTLLGDGRFAFLLMREFEDLRTLMDRLMKKGTCIVSRPFLEKKAKNIMCRVARGMFELHHLNIVHRDLKASNVLYSRFKKKQSGVVYDYDGGNNEVALGGNVDFFVADFECSIGVVGTGFFRAPEILQALKDKVLYTSPNLFTKEADVYSYGMLCYEILTGKLPFEGHHTNDYDLVLKGGRPEVPEDVEEWAHNLLCRCWQFNPASRPTFGEIIDLLEEVG